MSPALILLRFCALSLLSGCATLVPTTAAAASSGAPSACDALAHQLDAVATGPLFLASFPTVTEGPLYKTSFLYDQSVATIALVGCGYPMDGFAMAMLRAALPRGQ
jgi:hypothetical protein